MILGITGAFGCGKSAVLSYFSLRGWQVVSADQLCHELYEVGESSLLVALTERWGDQILDASGKVDRRELGRIVFSDPSELVELTRLIYPRLTERLDTVIGAWRQDHLNGVAEVPLLFEEHFESSFDATVAIWTANELRWQRLAKFRGFSSVEIRQREQLQMSSDLKLERADYGLINNGSRRELEWQIDQLLEQLN